MFQLDEYRFDFMHCDLREETPEMAETLGGTHVTSCTIGKKVGEEFVPLCIGFALCSVHDNFERAIGRKISLTRALKEAGFDKDFRIRVWWKYWSIVKK